MIIKRKSLADFLVLNTFWVGLSFKWNSLHVIILPAVLLHYVPENLKNTYLGPLTFAGMVVAMFLQPVSGSLSDRWSSSWGRRRPLILLGSLFDLVFLAALAWAGGLTGLALGYFGLQISSNIAHGPAQGLIPDNVSPDQYGAASGIKNLMDMGGLVVASLLMGNLVDPNAARATMPLLVVMAVMVVSTSITLVGVKEKNVQKADDDKATKQREDDNWRLKLKSVSNRYWWMVISRFVFLLGIYDIQVFAQYYIRDVIGVANPVKLTGDLLAAITLALVASAVAGGWMGDRFGHRRVLFFACGVAALGCLLLLGVRTPTLLLVFGAVLGIGIGLFLTGNWALANSLAPVEQAGFYLGLTNLATAGAGAVGRLGGPVIDVLNNAAPGAFFGYLGMFVFGAVCAVVSAVVLVRVKQ